MMSPKRTSQGHQRSSGEEHEGASDLKADWLERRNLIRLHPTHSTSQCEEAAELSVDDAAVEAMADIASEESCRCIL